MILTDILEAYVDGACRGNPGPSAIGVVFKKNGKVIKEVAKPIGDGTNNVAEYSALIFCLLLAIHLKENQIKIYTDSELVYQQVSGNYKIKNEKLKFFVDQVSLLRQEFKFFELIHVLRDKNKEADGLASGVLRSFKKNKSDFLFRGKKQTDMVASLFDDGGEKSPSSKG